MEKFKHASKYVLGEWKIPAELINLSIVSQHLYNWKDKNTMTDIFYVTFLYTCTVYLKQETTCRSSHHVLSQK